MHADALFQDAIAASNLGSLKTALQDCSYVDIESQNFLAILQLSIKNGDEAAFATLLAYVPMWCLKSRTRIVHTPQKGPWREMWDISRHCVVSIASESLQVLIFYLILYFLLLCSSIHSTGLIHELGDWLSSRLQNSPSPIDVWITMRIFNGLKGRFSRDFLFDTFDGALGFILLAIATKLTSQRSALGFHLHEALHSVMSTSGLLVRAFIAEYIPTWRRSYFSVVIGSNSSLARRPQSVASIDRNNPGDIILGQLLQSECNEVALMSRFLEKVKFEDIKNEYGPGHEIMIWAARKGSLDIVRKLLDLGVGINTSLTGTEILICRSAIAGSALFWAAMKGHPTMVQYLLRKGADPNHTIRPPLIGATLGSHRAYPKEVFSRYALCVFNLLVAGANPDSVDDEGRSVLSWSTHPGQKPILDLLLTAGASPDVSDNQLKLPIHYAASFWGSDQIVETLIEKTTNLDAVDKQGTSALTLSLWSADCPPTMKLLVDAVSDIDSGGGIFGCPLAAASRYCSSNILRMLLDKGANPNFCGGSFGSCLGAILHRPFSLEDDMACLELLLSHGADPNLRTITGEQALHIAARFCYQTEIFEILLKHGAEVNGVLCSREYDFDIETTPLGVLCRGSLHADAAMVLLKAGADPNCMTPGGQTALQAACDILGSSKLAQELLVRGADIGAQSVDCLDTALHKAAYAVRSDIIRALLEKEADANARNRELKTPLHQTCRREPLEVQTLLDEVESSFEILLRANELESREQLVESIVLLLTSGQADPKAKDIDGLTPLHHAIKASNWLSVMTLIQHSPCDIIFETDSNGRLPLHSAAEAGFTATLPYLADTSGKFWSEREFQHESERDSLLNAMRDSINAIDNSGDTALHHAARNGHEKFVANLRSLGGSSLDLDIQNHEGFTALDLAKKNNHVWLVSALKGRVV